MTVAGSGKPMRVLHLLAGSDAGGVSRYVRDLGDALVGRGHGVLAAGRRGAWHDLFQQATWPWLDVPLNGGPMALGQARQVLRQHIEALGGVDLIHAHYRRAALVGRKLAGDLGVPLLVSLHLTPIPLGPLRWLSEWGDHTLVASSMSRDWAIRVAGVSAQRVTCIPHGVDPQRWPCKDEQNRRAARQSLGLGDGELVAAYVGRFDRPKNEHWLASAAQAAQQAGLPLRVMMMGEGPRRPRLQRALAQAGVESRVTLLPYGDPLAVYQAADLLLLPSAREGFSLVCAEAMSVGTPVLRTETAGAAEQIVEGQTGWTTPVDRVAFVSAAVRVLGDRAALAAAGAAAAQHVRDHLRYDQQFERTEALYRQLMKRDL
jgi:glycosyltransferase involved in cell wall biosynthesis